MNLPDLWDECYTPEHRKLGNPNEFKATFCAKCVNVGCRNSAVAGTKWSRRMAAQEELLLGNPRYADPNDPTHAEIRTMDFKSTVRQAIALEVSARKGDWSVPTEDEVGEAAAEMVGVAPLPEPIAPEPIAPEPIAPEPVKERPQTAKRVIALLKEAADLITLDEILPNGERRKTVLEAYEKMRVALEPQPEPQGSWRVQGSGKTDYQVVWRADGAWSCTCPFFTEKKKECKHIHSMAERLKGSSPEPPTETEPRVRPGAPSGFRSRRNTAVPEEGILVGGSPAPPTPDPWAPPKEAEGRRVEVGGTVTIGGSKPPKKRGG